MITPSESLSDKQFDALVAFLDESEDTLSFFATEGLLAALATIPKVVPPGEWIGIVLGKHRFSNQAEAERILGWLMSHYNSVITVMEDDPPCLVPEPISGGQRDWCEGFLLGMELDADSVDYPGPSALLGAMAVVAGRLPFDELELEEKMSERKWRIRVAALLPDAVASLYDEFEAARADASVAAAEAAPEPVRRTERKVGRNEPCPCGSGKKFKRCCRRG
jgi:uncharacterized protein